MRTKKSRGVIVAGFDSPNLSAPKFPDALNGVDEKIDRLKYDESQGLTFVMETWRAPDDHDYVVIEWSPKGIDAWSILDTLYFPVAITTPTVERVIPSSILNHGRYDFRYMVKNGFEGPYTDFSEVSTADIDLFGPFKGVGFATKPPIVEFPEFLESTTDIINQTMIDANPDFPFTIKPYGDWEAGDNVAWWFTRETPADNSLPMNTEPMPEEGLEVDVPNTFFANPDVQDGIYFFVYKLLDPAGNESELSRTQGRVLKRSSGLILAPLIIREHTPDGLIDIPEWKSHVVVAIPSYAYDPTDQYIIKWGSQTYGPFPLTGVFDFEIELPDQLILDEFGASTVTVTTSATYEILRNGGTDSPPTATEIDVNLWAPGPNPPTPGEENPDLPLLDIRGPVSSTTLNYLNKDDFDDAGAIQALITLWMTPSPRGNDVIEVFWGSTSVLAGSLTLTTEAPGASIAIDLDKDQLATLGNGFHDVFYSVRESGTMNRNVSSARPVDVDDAIEHVMDPAQFRNVVPWSGDTRGRVNCTSVKGGPALPWAERYLEVWIPPNPEYFADGIDVVIEFHGSNGLNGELPAIANTTGTQTIRLDEHTAANGFMFHYGPYVPFLKPIEGYLSPFASSWLRYSIDLGGTWARSVPAVIPVRMYTSNDSCDDASLP